MMTIDTAIDAQPPVKRTTRYLTVAALFLVVMFGWGGVQSTIGQFIDPLQTAFAISRADAALAGSTLGIAIGIGVIFGGGFLSAAGPRLLLVSGLVLTAAALLIASLVSEFTLLLCCYAFAGIGIGIGVAVPVPYIIGATFGVRAAAAIGVAMAGFSVGSAPIVGLLHWVFSRWDWQAGYIAIALPILVIALPLAILVHIPPAAASAEKRSQGSQSTMSDILKSPGLGAILLGQLTFYLVNSTVMTHFLPHLADASWTPALSLFAFTIILVLNAPGKLFFGWLGDKVGPRSALGLAFLVQAAGLLLFVGASNPIAIWSAVALFGISWGAPSALVPALIISSLGLSRFGPASSAAGAAGLLGIAVGPYTAGVIYDRTGGYDFAWSAVSLIAAGVGVALLSWQSQKATPASDRASS